MPWIQSAVFFFFNDTATTEIYTLSLHDALPIYRHPGHQRVREEFAERRGADRALADGGVPVPGGAAAVERVVGVHQAEPDRKSTRLNSSHANISYAVFCLKKKRKPS